MGRMLQATLVCALGFAAAASAGGYPPQGIPKAPLRVDGSKQGGRLVEASFGYRTGPGECVSQGVLGDGSFPRARRIEPGPDKRLRFRLEAEGRPEASLRYWTAVDSEGYAQGESTSVPIELTERKPNGDFILEASLEVTGARYLRLSTSWRDRGSCGGRELLYKNYALAPKAA